MSTLKTSGLLVILASGPCGGSEPAPENADFTCASMFDTTCRFTAEVDLDGGALIEASIAPTAAGVRSTGQLQGLFGTVVFTDTTGELAPVTCTFAGDFDLVTDSEDGTVSVDAVHDVVLDADCPASCPWFLPGSGAFDADQGRYGWRMFEGQWELEFGATDPESPEIGTVLMWTRTSQTTIGGGATLDAPVDLWDGSWTAPVSLDAGSVADATCR